MATIVLSFVVAISGIALIPLAIASITASNGFFAYLRVKHHDLWVSLGEPTIWGGRQFASSPAVRYFTTRQYLSSTDTDLRQKGSRARAFVYAAATCFLVFVLSALALDALGA